MKKHSKRDIKVFLLGMLTMFLITLAVEWKEAVEGFNAGYSAVRGIKSN